jgi:hypothetical protein
VSLAAADARSRANRSIDGVVNRGLHRVIGTLVVLAVTAILLIPHFGAMVLAILVLALLFPTELFHEGPLRIGSGLLHAPDGRVLKPV